MRLQVQAQIALLDDLSGSVLIQLLQAPDCRLLLEEGGGTNGNVQKIVFRMKQRAGRRSSKRRHPMQQACKSLASPLTTPHVTTSSSAMRLCNSRAASPDNRVSFLLRFVPGLYRPDLPLFFFFALAGGPSPCAMSTQSHKGCRRYTASPLAHSFARLWNLKCCGHEVARARRPRSCLHMATSPATYPVCAPSHDAEATWPCRHRSNAPFPMALAGPRGAERRRPKDISFTDHTAKVPMANSHADAIGCSLATLHGAFSNQPPPCSCRSGHLCALHADARLRRWPR